MICCWLLIVVGVIIVWLIGISTHNSQLLLFRLIDFVIDNSEWSSSSRVEFCFFFLKRTQEFMESKRANEEERRTQMKLVDISWAQYRVALWQIIQIYIYIIGGGIRKILSPSVCECGCDVMWCTMYEKRSGINKVGCMGACWAN